MDHLIERVASTYFSTDSNKPNSYKSLVGVTPVDVSSGPANLFGYNIYNPNATDVFIKFYNPTGVPVVGTTVPVITLQVPATGSIVLVGTDLVLRFTKTIYIAIVTGYLDSSTTAPATTCLTQLFWK